MKLLAVLVVALLCGGAYSQSICDKYSAALNYTNLELVGTLVGQVFEAATAPDSPLLEFFDGTTPEGSTDYTDPANSNQTQALAGSLVAFFGAALGCSDGTVPDYTGKSMVEAHADIPIKYVDFVIFNNAVLGVMSGAGVDAEDIATVAGVLRGLKEQICNQEDCNSFCNRYSNALGLTNYALVETVVLNVFGLLTDPDSPLLEFFDGTTPEGSTNYTDPANAAQVGVLAGHLITFFGGALGCSDGSIGAYTGRTMEEAHENIPIDLEAFNQFNDYVIEVLDTAGVSDEDLAAARALLDSLLPAICNQPDCMVTSSSEETPTETSETSATSANPTTDPEGSSSSILAPVAAVSILAAAML